LLRIKETPFVINAGYAKASQQKYHPDQYQTGVLCYAFWGTRFETNFNPPRTESDPESYHQTKDCDDTVTDEGNKSPEIGVEGGSSR
jgi:hypothetical protein